MKSAICEGWVRHRRTRPTRHQFRYPLFMMYLDLGELDEVFRGRWLWSTRRISPLRFRRHDYLGDPDRPLDECVRELVSERTGLQCSGPVHLLTHLRCLGYGFNPVSFYFCHAQDGERLQALVAEVTNTPWGERHAYVLPVEGRNHGGGRYRFTNSKEFHVSPFLPMEMRYEWMLLIRGSRMLVHIENHDADGKVFDATLSMRSREVTGLRLAGLLLRYPPMPWRVTAAIHAQAARLWRKGVPIFTHPGRVRGALR